MCGSNILTAEVRERIAAHRAVARKTTLSPFGPDDEIGMLNLLTKERAREVVSKSNAAESLDLGVDIFMGMPSWQKAGDPPFQQWMTHTPLGTVHDDLSGFGEEQNRLVGYSGDAVSMYTHTGTHIDTLNHFGYGQDIWNGFNAEEHLTSRHWLKCGADKIPPIIGRAVLFDIAALHDTDVLPDNYGIGADDLQEALKRQNVEFNPGDIALVRTGRMQRWPDPEAYITNSPGLNLEGSQWLAKAGAAVIGGDNSALEQMPSADAENWQVVHTYLLGEAGVPIMEIVNCEELSERQLYEFAFVAANLKFRGATAAPLRPIAMPFE